MSRSQLIQKELVSALEAALAEALLDPGPGVFQIDGDVEDRLIRGRIGMQREAAVALELELLARANRSKLRFNEAGENGQRVWVEAGQEA